MLLELEKHISKDKNQKSIQHCKGPPQEMERGDQQISYSENQSWSAI